MSLVTKFGAFAPTIKTAPINKSVFGNNSSILWLFEYRVYTFGGIISFKYLNLSGLISNILPFAPNPAANLAALAPASAQR